MKKLLTIGIALALALFACHATHSFAQEEDFAPFEGVDTAEDASPVEDVFDEPQIEEDVSPEFFLEDFDTQPGRISVHRQTHVDGLVDELADVPGMGPPENPPRPSKPTGGPREMEWELSDIVWKFLSRVAVNLLSGNEGHLLSENEPSVLSDNETQFFSGNTVSIFSNIEIHIQVSESGNQHSGPPRQSVIPHITLGGDQSRPSGDESGHRPLNPPPRPYTPSPSDDPL